MSVVFMSPQLALLAHNPVPSRKSIFVITVNTKYFVIVILAWIFWDVITSLCLRGLIQDECFLRMSLAFTFQGILNLKCYFTWRASYFFRSVRFASSFHGRFIFVFWKRRYVCNFNCFLWTNYREVFPEIGMSFARRRYNAIGRQFSSSGKLNKSGRTLTI
jgi:hypothetical protein